MATDTGGSAAAVPGQMSQEPAPMDQDPKDGGELPEEEQETWNRLELGRAQELGRALAAELAVSQEEAGVATAREARESGSPGRTPNPDR
eukprot:14418328-Heterocapsa_arctica.AAC.1